MSIDNDPRPGRPKTSTEERSAKPVTDGFEEDLERREQKLRRKMHKNRSQFLVAGPQRTYARTTFFFSGRAFYRRFPSYSTHE